MTGEMESIPRRLLCCRTLPRDGTKPGPKPACLATHSIHHPRAAKSLLLRAAFWSLVTDVYGVTPAAVPRSLSLST
jgi:hypothetical protein